MNKLTTKTAFTIFVFILGVIIVATLTLLVKIKQEPTIKQFSKPEPYTPIIRNEHDVLLVNKGDTIELYLENAYALQDEYVIFVKHFNGQKQR